MKIKIRNNPEQKIRSEIIALLHKHGWFVIITHGSVFQKGLPDLFACHKSYGMRWIEVKLHNMEGSHFTGAQLDVFPKMIANGANIYVLTAGTEKEYEKLFKPCNFMEYYLLHLRKTY